MIVRGRIMLVSSSPESWVNWFAATNIKSKPQSEKFSRQAYFLSGICMSREVLRLE